MIGGGLLLTVMKLPAVVFDGLGIYFEQAIRKWPFSGLLSEVAKALALQRFSMNLTFEDSLGRTWHELTTNGCRSRFAMASQALRWANSINTHRPLCSCAWSESYIDSSDAQPQTCHTFGLVSRY